MYYHRLCLRNGFSIVKYWRYISKDKKSDYSPKTVLANSDIFNTLYITLKNRFGFLKSYERILSAEFYYNIDLKFFERIKTIIILRSEISKFSLSIVQNFVHSFNNVFINPYFYTYYNQNILSRVSRVLNSAAKNEIRKLKLIRN